ncbi:MAG: thiol:disulfide interchange protein [Cellvibrionaceae bacterium]
MFKQNTVAFVVWVCLILHAATIPVSSADSTSPTALGGPLTDEKLQETSAFTEAGQGQSRASNLSLGNLAASEDFLPVDDAYQLSLRQIDIGLEIDWVIADGYFLYGEQFRFIINGQALNAQLPTGEVSYDPIFEKEVEKHYHYVNAFIAKAKLPSQPGFELAVTSQGCADAGLCYPPQTRYFLVDAKGISPISEIIQPSALSANDGSINNSEITGSSRSTDSSATKVLLMLALALVGGIILNLMPCVLPVLSLKALSMASNPGNHRAQGLSYTMGVVISFILVAAALLATRAAGQAVGWGFQLQSPGFVALLVFLFFIMGLSLSGYIPVGARWMHVGDSLTRGSGLPSSFFTGVLAAVVASPCTAPFMATALGFAITQTWWIALSVFAVLGFGMALPLLLLSYVPKLGKYLPKPGPWTEIFKQALAFPLYLTAIWLLWVLGRQLGDNAVVFMIIGCLLILFAYWLARYLTVVRRFIVIGNLLIVIIFTGHISQSPIKASTINAASPWETYSEQRLRELRQRGQPVFVNLTADWCITCKWNEALVFTTDTIAAMESQGIYLMEGDWTNYDPEITRLLETYDRGGVPLYLLFPAQADSEPRILPQILTPDTFKRAIESI